MSKTGNNRPREPGEMFIYVKDDDRLPRSSVASQPAKSFQEQDQQAVAESKKFPKSVFFIIGNEFCERFSFYGMKAILPIYLTAWLSFSEDQATTIIHTFNFAAYFFTLPGGIISDSWLGKFKTIFFLSILYAAGSVVLALTSFPGVTGIPPHWWGAMAGLGLIVVGTGGIKPCVSSFGGDQFKPTQAALISIFFSWFYWSINAGSMLSMFITPVLRENVHCFGQDSCYPLAFGLPAVLMLLALGVFVLGYKAYVHVPPSGNGVVQVIKACFVALLEKISLKRSGFTYERPKHWIYYASGRFSDVFLTEVRIVLAIIILLSPVSFFWALYDQQGSRWTYQGMMMENHLWQFDIKPEQMGIINALLILILLPIFEYIIYPFFKLVGLPLKPLARMMGGMLLAIVSFLMAAALQFHMERVGTFVANPADPSALICTENCVHILWQGPQYFVLTCAEVMLSVTGLEFAYSQAPSSMKSVCQATWLLTVATGNLIVIVVTIIDPVRRFTSKYVQAWNFVLWACILVVGTLMFAIVAARYKYVEDRIADGELAQLQPISPRRRKSREAGLGMYEDQEQSSEDIFVLKPGYGSASGSKTNLLP